MGSMPLDIFYHCTLFFDVSSSTVVEEYGTSNTIMKLLSWNLFFTVALWTVTRICDAYIGIRTGNQKIPTSTCLYVEAKSRRNWVKEGCSTIALIHLHHFTSLPVHAAENKVDYSKIQDLLGPGGGDYISPYQIPEGGKRPTWLTEPTDEFKESEQKAMDFKRKNLIISKQFQSLLDIITTAPNNEQTLLDTLDSLRRLVKSNGGLPIGITKDEIVKTCRRRKSKKYWPTSVEVAYVLERCCRCAQ
jgi:hypothetical protein